MKTTYNAKRVVPFLLAVAFAAGTAAHLVAVELTTRTIGSQSSTSAILVFFIPLYTCGAGVAGYVLGLFSCKIFKIYKIHILALLAISLPVATLLPFFTYQAGVLTVEKSYILNKPGVVFSNIEIVKSSLPSLPENVSHPSNEDKYNIKILSKSIFPYVGFSRISISDPKEKATHTIWTRELQKDGAKALTWNGEEVLLCYSYYDVLVVKFDGSTLIKESLGDFDYINEASAFQVEFASDEPSYLVVFTKLRATSGNYMLLIYAPDGTLVYQELIKKQSREMNLYKKLDMKTQIEGIVIKNKEAYEYALRK